MCFQLSVIVGSCDTNSRVFHLGVIDLLLCVNLLVKSMNSFVVLGLRIVVPLCVLWG